MSLRKQGTCADCGNLLYGDDYGAAGHRCEAKQMSELEEAFKAFKEKIYDEMVAWSDMQCVSNELYKKEHYEQNIEKAYKAGALALLEYAESKAIWGVPMGEAALDHLQTGKLGKQIVELLDLQTWCHGEGEK